MTAAPDAARTARVAAWAEAIALWALALVCVWQFIRAPSARTDVPEWLKVLCASAYLSEFLLFHSTGFLAPAMRAKGVARLGCVTAGILLYGVIVLGLASSIEYGWVAGVVLLVQMVRGARHLAKEGEEAFRRHMIAAAACLFGPFLLGLPVAAAVRWLLGAEFPLEGADTGALAYFGAFFFAIAGGVAFVRR